MSAWVMKVRAFFAVAIATALAGCGASINSPGSDSAPIAAKPDVVVTIDGARHTCVVALYTEAQGSMVACEDVAPFLRDELRLVKGSIYGLRLVPAVDAAQMSKVEADLQGAGYRFIGGPRPTPTPSPSQPH